MSCSCCRPYLLKSSKPSETSSTSALYTSEDISTYAQKFLMVFILIYFVSFLCCCLFVNCHGFRESLSQILEAGKVVDNPISLADFGATLTSADSSQLQAVLECNHVSWVDTGMQ